MKNMKKVKNKMEAKWKIRKKNIRTLRKISFRFDSLLI